MPGRFRFDGLHAKSFGHGDPAYIRRQSLIRTVCKHISHPSRADKAYYDVSDFISFSKDKNRALYWLTDKGTRSIHPCKVAYTETRYLFTMSIPQHELVSECEGIYSFSFYCDPHLREPNADTSMDWALIGMVNCPCVQSGIRHKIVLIDAVQFLNAHHNAATSGDAKVLATEDQEWLVIPNDPSRPFGRSSRIQRACFWSAKLFNADGEFRDSMAYAAQGMEYIEK